MRRALVVAALAFLAACSASNAPDASSADPATNDTSAKLANGCFSLRTADGRFIAADGDGYRAGHAQASAFFLKPSLPGAYLPLDQDGWLLSARDGDAIGRDDAPGPATEWRFEPLGTQFVIRSNSNDHPIGVSSSGAVVQTEGQAFEVVAATGCRAFPEIEVNAAGKPFAGTAPDGTVLGYSDLHLHITTELRAGGLTIYGEPFHRFGVDAALGRDADVHGPEGALDVTGNLLRTSLPVGTHDTHGWPTFAGWPVFDTNTHQQTYYRWLERAWMAGERLVVAQAVEDEPICEIEPRRSHSCDETATIELEVAQLKAMQDYIDAQSGGAGRGWFRLAFDPAQARRVIEEGKLAVVIGVESSNLFGCSELLDQPQCTREDVDRGIAHLKGLGIRSFFPAHWVDNAFAGAALEGGAKGTFISTFEVQQTGHPFRTAPCPLPGQGEPLVAGPPTCNAKGLTELGEYLIQRLIEEHLLIEVDHISERARGRILEIAEAAHYPLVSSHTNTGGAWTDEELDRLYALGGIGTARVDTAPGFAARVLELQGHRNENFFFGVGFGTDTGGFASLPGPRADAAQAPLAYPFTSFRGDVDFEQQRSGERTYDLNVDGVAHYGLIADLVADVQSQAGGAAMDPLFRSAEAYLQMWQRAVDHR